VREGDLREKERGEHERKREICELRKKKVLFVSFYFTIKIFCYIIYLGDVVRKCGKN
jgi:hypothetical protein